MMHELRPGPERCLLAGITWHHSKWVVEDYLSELAELAKTAGADVIDYFIQERSSPDSAWFIGKGKATEIREYIVDHAIDLLIFDDELSPAQVKNLEELTQIKVLDRSGLILDIFAAHARTKEARTQVELAQLRYFLPRLTRQWSHLSRQEGGIGTRGPGETQLETDKRLIRSRISHLQTALERIGKQKAVQRRKAEDYIRIALVGYTNAGKSTLLNVLTDADAYVANKLFATLDTTVKRMDFFSGFTVLLSDTVGFIRKLPHELIASFRTTLAQTIESDLLIHVIDVSEENFSEKIEIVNTILKDLNIGDTPVILAMNKVDLLANVARLQEIKRKYPDACFLSARKKIRLDSLKQLLIDKLDESFTSIDLKLNYASEYEIISRLANWGVILNREYDEKEVLIKFRYLKKYRKEVDIILKKYASDATI